MSKAVSMLKTLITTLKFAISRIYSLEAFIFIMVVIAGNTIGGMLIPMLKLIGKEKKAEEVK